MPCHVIAVGGVGRVRVGSASVLLAFMLVCRVRVL